MAAPKEQPQKFEVLPGYDPKQNQLANEEMRTVLYGYGKVASDYVQYVDSYKFVGGVGRNIPKVQADAWKKGVRIDGKPATSRIFPQAILPSDADEVMFAEATGVQPLTANKLAAMINATDAEALVAALGTAGAAELAEKLLQTAAKNAGK